MSSLFKFTKDGVTRRTTFPANAQWLEIAAKIESLYGIPIETAAVVYIDDDGDEITVSSQEELQDYYRGHPNNKKEFAKFTVVDLATLRAAPDKPLPDTPRTSHHLHGAGSTNTFGAVPFNYEGDDDWQRIPGFGGRFTPPTDGMRFVELSSDAGSHVNETPVEGSVAGSESTTRGRARQTNDDVSSINSAIENDTPSKPEVHVYAADRSTSEAAPQSKSGSTTSSTDAVPDPPLPDLEPNPRPTPSLTNDVATLLSTITATFSSNPELAEGLKGILRNVNNGSYWSAHRDEVTRAAEQIRRSSMDLHTRMMSAAADGTANEAEQQASRRIAEAVANIVRSLSEMAGRPNGPPGDSNGASTLWSAFGSRGAPPPPHPPHPPHAPYPAHPPQHGRGHHGHGPHGHTQNHSHGHGPHHGHPHNPNNPFMQFGRPPPPPHGPNAPWSHGPGRGHGPPPMPWMGMGMGPPPHHGGADNVPLDLSDDDSDEGEDAEVSMYGISQRLPLAQQKERLQAAKAAYIAEKQKYRAEKQARRRERMQRSNSNLNQAMDTEPRAAGPSSGDGQMVVAPTQLISHGRGQFPPLELFSIPRRQVSGGRGRHQRQPSNSTTNTETSKARVTRRLSDMGFNDPSIESRVSVHIPDNEVREKAAEDTVVSNVVEELLTNATIAPTSTRHTSRRED